MTKSFSAAIPAAEPDERRAKSRTRAAVEKFPAEPGRNRVKQNHAQSESQIKSFKHIF